MSEIPKVIDSLGVLELAAVLRDAHHAVTGDFPIDARLGVAWAQCALEHGHGKYIYCHNLGNVSAFAPWTGDYYVIHVQEQTDPTNPDPALRWKWVDMRFRAHDDFIDGAIDYWKVITGRYASALPSFDAGDPSGAAMALHAKGYFTANPIPYAHTMVGLYQEFVSSILPSL